MTAALLALAALAQPQCHARPWEMQRISEEAERASQRHGLPAGLLVAVVLAESGGRNIISRRRRCGGRDVGVGQIHAHDAQRFRRLLVLATNLDRAAAILAASRRRCAATACRCREAHYNWNGRTRWCRRVHRIWRELMRSSRGEA
jgi:hypothetical protein